MYSTARPMRSGQRRLHSPSWPEQEGVGGQSGPGRLRSAADGRRERATSSGRPGASSGWTGPDIGQPAAISRWAGAEIGRSDPRRRAASVDQPAVRRNHQRLRVKHSLIGAKQQGGVTVAGQSGPARARRRAEGGQDQAAASEDDTQARRTRARLKEREETRRDVRLGRGGTQRPRQNAAPRRAWQEQHGATAVGTTAKSTDGVRIPPDSAS